jgi:putative sterol carrier protein
MKTYAKLKPLVREPGSIKDPKDLNLDEAGQAVAKGLEGMRDEGTLEYYVLEEGKAAPFRMELKGGKAAISKETTGKADFIVKADRATMAAFAKGELSPVDAYLSGRMEVHGNLDFAKRLFAKLAAQSGEKEF